MSPGDDALGDRPDPIELQAVDRQAAERGQDLDAVDLSVAVGVLFERHVPNPVPAVLNRPPVYDMPQQGLGSGPQALSLVTSFTRRLALVDDVAAHRNDRGAARPVLQPDLRCGHSPQGQGDVKAPFHLTPASAPENLQAVGQPVSDQLKLLTRLYLTEIKKSASRWAR